MAQGKTMKYKKHTLYCKKCDYGAAGTPYIPEFFVEKWKEDHKHNKKGGEYGSST